MGLVPVVPFLCFAAGIAAAAINASLNFVSGGKIKKVLID